MVQAWVGGLEIGIIPCKVFKSLLAQLGDMGSLQAGVLAPLVEMVKDITLKKTEKVLKSKLAFVGYEAVRLSGCEAELDSRIKKIKDKS